jgi:hypothetical protein
MMLVHTMDIWSANSAEISFVISFSSPNGAVVLNESRKPGNRSQARVKYAALRTGKQIWKNEAL